MYYVTNSPAVVSSAIGMASGKPAMSKEMQVTEGAGLQFNIVQYPTEQVNMTPQRMLHVIAMALDMSPECYKMKTRVRNIVELRFIASLFLRRHFPALTLYQIAAYFGGQDHSSVINGLSRAYNLIYTKDSQFLKKYNSAVKSVNTWLRREA